MQLVSIVFALTLLAVCTAHGLCVTPNQRGTQKVWDFNPFAKEVDPDAEIDFKPHFPSGSKVNEKGAGRNSQRAASMPEGWTPFEPLKEGFKWRAGVCGDTINGPQDHKKGGKFYNDGIIVAEYQQGGILKVELNIVAHHNGFMELHVCDVKHCEDEEISPKCFTDGHCYPLERAYNAKCDERKSNNCGPIDRNYKGRWYLPCSPTYPEKAHDYYGRDDTILYKLPDDLACEHCVLHWFWTAANDCNPPGVIEYFEGPDAPTNWPKCDGEGGAVGGYAKNHGPCGGSKNPEEYYQCADIRITPREMRGLPSTPKPNASPELSESPNPTKTPTPSQTPEVSQIPVTSAAASVTPELSPEGPENPKASPEAVSDRGGEKTGRDGVIQDLVLVADSKKIQSINDGQTINVANYERIAIECVTDRKVEKVEFFIDGLLVWTDYFQPYFMFGNKGNGPFYWDNPILDRTFKLVTKAGGDEDTVEIKLIKEA